MKYLLIISMVFATIGGNAQVFNDVLKKAKKQVSGESETKLTNEEVVSGLKEALTRGAKLSSDNASKLNGYYKNTNIKIPFPPEAVRVKQKLDAMGMKPQTEKFVRTMNRAAEEAAKEAAPIFVQAIKGMSVGDGFAILKGKDDAATEYLKRNTREELTKKFKPIIKKAIDKVELTKAWKPLITKYNQIPLVEKQNPNLEDYINEKALEGLFYLVAKEELKIRQDPVARVSDLLKKVFSSLDG